MLIYGYCPGAWVGVFSLAPAKKSVSGSTTLIWRKLTKRIGSIENLSAKYEITFFFYLYFCMFLIKVLDQDLPNWIWIFGTDPDRKNCVSNGFFSESGSDFSELGSKLTINVDPMQILKKSIPVITENFYLIFSTCHCAFWSGLFKAWSKMD